METIVLEVDDASAKAWNNSSPSLRAAYEGKIIAIHISRNAKLKYKRK